MEKANAIDWVAMVLVIVGGLNWLLYGLFNQLDLVETLFGGYNIAARVVYALVGVAAIYLIYMAVAKMS